MMRREYLRMVMVILVELPLLLTLFMVILWSGIFADSFWAAMVAMVVWVARLYLPVHWKSYPGTAFVGTARVWDSWPFSMMHRWPSAKLYVTEEGIILVTLYRTYVFRRDEVGIAPWGGVISLGGKNGVMIIHSKDEYPRNIAFALNWGDLRGIFDSYGYRMRDWPNQVGLEPRCR